MMISIRRLITGVATAAVVTLMASGNSFAAPVPTARIATGGSGVRLTVSVAGTPLPRSVSVRSRRVVVVLTGSGASRRSPRLTGARATAFRRRAGKSVAVRMKVGRHVRTVATTLLEAGTGGGAAGSGAPGVPVAGGTALPNAPAGGVSGQAAVDLFSGYLRGSVMTNITASANLSSQSTTRFTFCQGGTSLVYYRESIGTSTASTETAQASYRVTQAAFNAAGTLGEGLVEYSGAAPGNTSIGQSGQAIVRLGSGIAWINSLGAEYQWQSGVAGC